MWHDHGTQQILNLRPSAGFQDKCSQHGIKIDPKGNNFVPAFRLKKPRVRTLVNYWPKREPERD